MPSKCRQKTEKAKLDTDLSLRLPLERFKFLEFELFDEIVEVGYQHAKMKISEWKDNLEHPKKSGNP